MSSVSNVSRRRGIFLAGLASLASLLSVGACRQPDAVVGSAAPAAESVAQVANRVRSLSGSYVVDSITLETRYWNGTSTLPTTATAAAAFNALPTNVAGYTNAPWLIPNLAPTVQAVYTDPAITWADTSWNGVMNPAGAHQNVATRYRIHLSATTVSQVRLEFGIDFLGGAMWVDGTPVAEDWLNPWWMGFFDTDTNSYAGCSTFTAPPCLPLYAPSKGTFATTMNLSVGRHVVEVIGFENGDDAGAAARIDRGTGYQAVISANQPSQTLTVTAPSGGKVVSNPAGINCPGTCSASFPLGSTVTLAQTPNTGFVFTGWTGACSGTAGCTVQMYGARSVGASFAGLPSVTGMTVETRYWNLGAFTKTGAGAQAYFNTLPTNVAGYTNEPVPVTQLVRNAQLFTAPTVGANLNLASRYVITMNATSTGPVQLRFSGDMGYGATMLVDGTEATSFWGNAVGGQFLFATSNLTLGTHTITVIGFEDCCEGTSPLLEYNVGNGWMTAVAPALPAIPLSVSLTAGTGTVISSPTGINCGAICTANFATGSQVVLTATPAQYFGFNGWGGACTGTAQCVVRMLAPSRSVTATFSRIAWPVTLTTNGTGGGTVTTSPAGTSCGTNCVQFAPGTSVTFTATPDANSTFASWTGLTGCTTSPCTVTVNSALTVAATFNKKQYVVTVTPSGTGTGAVTSSPAGISCGSVCAASFALGSTVTLTAAPLPGSSFAGWTGACVAAGSNPVCTVSVTGVLGVGVQFTKLSDTTPPTLSCVASPNELWPPDHKMRDVRVTVTMKDNAAGSLSYSLISVTSDESDDSPERGKVVYKWWGRDYDRRSKTERHKKHVGGGKHADGDDCGYDDDDDGDQNGDGNTSNDIQGWTLNTPDVFGQFRAERSGSGDGRVYTLTYKGTDAAGNTATTSCTVTVPKAQGMVWNGKSWGWNWNWR